MNTLKELFEKYGYSTNIKFKTNKKFLVPLNQLEITSWGPMGDGIFPKHNACLCETCIRSRSGDFHHDYLQRNDDGNVIDGFTYPDVLNLEVNTESFYIDALPANFKTSPKLNEEQITEMFYNHIINSNYQNKEDEEEEEKKDLNWELIFTHSIFDKVFENDLMLLNKLKSWSVFNISKNLYKESQDTIDRFFIGFEQYLENENDKNLFASRFENLFASYKVDLGKELKNQIGVEKDENYVIINDIKFLVDFNTFRIATFDKVYNKWCQTYIESKFKYIKYMFLESNVKIKVKECDSSYILIFLNNENNENFEIVLNEWIENFDNNCLINDNKSDGESYTDDDGIELIYENCSLCGKNKE